MRFRELFEGAESRSETVATFLAVLEMLKANRMFVFEEKGELVCCDKDTEGGGDDENRADRGNADGTNGANGTDGTKDENHGSDY